MHTQPDFATKEHRLTAIRVDRLSAVLFFILLSKIYVVEGFPSDVPPKTGNKLLLISLDGFRHDYLDVAKLHGYNISGFEKIWYSGFRVLRVQNEFITRTAPNHYTIVTGLHEESHGLVDNSFYDPHLREVFNLHNSTQAEWSVWFDSSDAEPIWVTNQRHGHCSGVTSWTGSFAPIRGMVPSKHFPVYNMSVPFRTLIEQAITWLSEDDMTLVLVYYHQPDRQGHLTGPLSSEVMETISKINEDIEYLLARVKSTPILNSLNLILTSDHGMANVNSAQVIVLEHYLPQDLYFSPGKDVRVFWSLWPTPGSNATNLFTRLHGKHLQMNVYYKEILPDRLFYKHNYRIAPVLVYSNPGWLIAKSNASRDSMRREGDHGYDPASSDMSPFFLASGPGFADFGENRTFPSINMVDIYPLMCHLLDLQHPNPHNGSFDRIAHLVRSTKADNYWFGSLWDLTTVLLVFSLAVCLGAAALVSVCLVHCRDRSTSTDALLRRRRRRLKSEPALSLTRLFTSTDRASRTNAVPIPEDLQQLIHSPSDNDEIVYFDHSDKFYVDDRTFLNMLHGSKSSI